jgi:hypothetical protein
MEGRDITTGHTEVSSENSTAGLRSGKAQTSEGLRSIFGTGSVVMKAENLPLFR